jgi:hypothetical protein
MADLKAGTLADFASSMAAYMEKAMQNEWLAVKGTALPSGPGDEDRKILFAAVAQGVLKYLYDHRADISTLSAGGDSHQHTADFTVSAYRTPLP